MKMGACTHHHVNYFAIDVRCVDEEKNYTIILAIRATQAQYSSKFSTQLVKDVFQDYGIQKDHALCIVTGMCSMWYGQTTQ